MPHGSSLIRCDPEGTRFDHRSEGGLRFLRTCMSTKIGAPRQSWYRCLLGSRCGPWVRGSPFLLHIGTTQRVKTLPVLKDSPSRLNQVALCLFRSRWDWLGLPSFVLQRAQAPPSYCYCWFDILMAASVPETLPLLHWFSVGTILPSIGASVS